MKNFGRVQALRGLNLKVGKGVFGLIGPNAAGKTTTLKILLGLVRASSGEARVFDLDTWKDSFEIRTRTGVLHEKPRFPGWVSGREYLEQVSRLKGVPKPRETTLQELESFGLADAAERKIGTYSAGMVQRLGIAQAFIGRPELVFLDEPTANLDPLGRAEFLDMIKEHSRSIGVSVMISTHILSELERVCDSVAVIYNGLTLEQGNLGNLAERYSENLCVVEFTDNAKIAEELAKLDSVERVWLEDNVFNVKARDEDRLYRDIVDLAHNAGVGIRKFEPKLIGLEEIYKKVMEKGAATHS